MLSEFENFCEKKRMTQDKPTANLTTAQTDSESGTEGLTTPQDIERHKAALKALFDKGLMSEAEYEAEISKLSFRT